MNSADEQIHWIEVNMLGTFHNNFMQNSLPLILQMGLFLFRS